MGMNGTKNGSSHAPQDLKLWRENMGFSIEEACALLEVERAQYESWESGAAPTPRYAALACAALALGIKA